MKRAVVKVELDTTKAKQDLKALAKEGEKAAGRANDSLGGGFGRAGALGAAAGAGFGLAQRAASRVSGFASDQIAEGTAGTRAIVDAEFGGPEARAARTARERTSGAFAEILGRMKDPSITPSIQNFYDNTRDLAEITERGRSFANEKLGGDVVGDAVKGVIETIDAGFDRMIDALQVGSK